MFGVTGRKSDIGRSPRRRSERVLAGKLEMLKMGAGVHRGPKTPRKVVFYRPGVQTDVKTGMKVIGEEVFGPIAPISRSK